MTSARAVQARSTLVRHRARRGASRIRHGTSAGLNKLCRDQAGRTASRPPVSMLVARHALAPNTARYLAIAPPPAAAAGQRLSGCVTALRTGRGAPDGASRRAAGGTSLWAAGATSTTDPIAAFTDHERGHGLRREPRMPGAQAQAASTPCVGEQEHRRLRALGRRRAPTHGQNALFTVKRVDEPAFAFDDSVTITMPSGEFAIVRELTRRRGAGGSRERRRGRCARRGQAVRRLVMTASFTTGRPLMNGVRVSRIPSGRARDATAGSAGYYES